MFFRACLVFVLLAGILQGRLEVARPFSDHAVLQAEKDLPVWGKSDPGALVEVWLGKRKEETKALASGFWQVDFPAAGPSGEGIEMTISAGDEKITRRDLVFGEVWIASGQSNMWWPLKSCEDGKGEIESGGDAGLRIFNLQGRLHPGGRSYSREFLKNVTKENYYESDGWQVASAQSLPQFSGVGYFFAKRLRGELKVPIGVIQLAVGGSPIEAHLPRRTMAEDPKLRGLLKEWWKNPDYPKWCRERAALNLKHWLVEAGPDESPPHPFAPAFLWEAGIEQLRPFPVSGFLWYQGESNATLDGGGGNPASKEVNHRMLSGLVRAWREAWKDEELPVYQVQLPGLNRRWAVFREMQLELTKELPNVGMAVTIDVGNPTNVHPGDKKTVGDRLAGLALEKRYGKGVASNGPFLVKAEMTSGKAKMTFDQKLFVRGGKVVRGVELAGHDRVFYPANSKVRGRLLEAFSEEVGEPIALRYAWANDPKGNLVNEEGLPASPFRTDDWAVRKEGRIRVACIGDSITAGFGIPELENHYPAVLGRLLGAKYEVRNFGNSGRGVVRRSMKGTEKRAFFFMPEYEASLAFEPDVVICNLGINDLMDWQAFGKEDFVDDYRKLIRRYREMPNKPRVILWGPLAPLFPGQTFHGSRGVGEINAAIERVAELEGVELIDMTSPLRERGDLFPDHLHPNAEGAGVIAGIVAGHLGTKADGEE